MTIVSRKSFDLYINIHFPIFTEWIIHRQGHHRHMYVKRTFVSDGASHTIGHLRTYFFYEPFNYSKNNKTKESRQINTQLQNKIKIGNSLKKTFV